MTSIKLARWKKGGLDANDICITVIHNAVESLYPDIDTDPIPIDLRINKMVYNKEPGVVDMLKTTERYLTTPGAKTKDYQSILRDHCTICAMAVVAQVCPYKVIKWETPCVTAYDIFKAKYINKVGSGTQSINRYKISAINGDLTKELIEYGIPDLTVGELFTVIRYYTKYTVSNIIGLSYYEFYLLLLKKMNGVFSYRNHKDESFIYFVCVVKWIADVIGEGIEQGTISKPLKYSLHRPNHFKKYDREYKFQKMKKSEFMKICYEYY